MDPKDALAAVTSTWAVLMAVSPALQIRQMLRTRSSADVSVGYFAILVIGFLLWAAYGFSIGNLVVALPNSIAAVVGGSTLAIALVLRRAAARRLQESAT